MNFSEITFLLSFAFIIALSTRMFEDKITQRVQGLEKKEPTEEQVTPEISTQTLADRIDNSLVLGGIIAITGLLLFLSVFLTNVQN